VRLSKALAAGAALSMMAAPTLSQAATAAHPARAASPTMAAEDLRGGFIIPLLAVVAVILGILALTDDDNEDLPHSP